MEKENKYYTPTIEEFHVGFEFEIYYSLEEPFWLQEKHHKLYNYWDLIRMIEDSSVRIKYLDKEDIESLGWFHFSSDFSFSVFTKIKDKEQKYYLEYDHDLNTLEISIVNSEGNIFVKNLFSGKIKNKSELKKLMEMLEIC